jgi:hypothetical protein
MKKGYLSHVDCMKMGGLGVDGRRKEVVYGHDIFFFRFLEKQTIIEEGVMGGV